MVSEVSKAKAFETAAATRNKTLSKASLAAWVLTLALFTLGLGLRLYDLTDQPLDFHSTRQLRGAIIARGMYYEMLPNADPEQRDLAISFWNSTGQYEPSVVEKLVAYTYLLIGEETLWVSRIYTSLFWIIGGAALFALARRMLAGDPDSGANRAWISPGMAAALAALAYYLILPFGVQASRSFQPDPGMVMWMLLALYGLLRWSETRSWKWALLTGVTAGIAVLTKVVAAYILAGAALAIVLSALGLKRSWRSLQGWSMAILMVAPTAVYYLSREGRASQYIASWTVSLSHLLLEPSFYMRWLNLVQDLMGMTVLVLALVGVLISWPRNRTILAGLWLGYAVYGLFLPYQMYTHNYYHLQLIPILALSIAPVAQMVFERVFQQGKLWQILFIGVVLMGIIFPAWESIYTQMVEDNRREPAHWQEIASYLPTDGKILALTQDYGYRLMYYGWRKVILWPNRGEQRLSALRGNNREFENFFARRIEGKDYFLITAFNQFNDQPDLKQTLYDRYPLLAEGSGYLIFDLAHPFAAASP